MTAITITGPGRKPITRLQAARHLNTVGEATLLVHGDDDHRCIEVHAAHRAYGGITPPYALWSSGSGDAGQARERAELMLFVAVLLDLANEVPVDDARARFEQEEPERDRAARRAEILRKYAPPQPPAPQPPAIPQWLASRPVWCGTGEPRVVHLDEAQLQADGERWRAAGFVDARPFADHPAGEQCPVCSDPAKWAAFESPLDPIAPAEVGYGTGTEHGRPVVTCTTPDGVTGTMMFARSPDGAAAIAAALNENHALKDTGDAGS